MTKTCQTKLQYYFFGEVVPRSAFSLSNGISCFTPGKPSLYKHLQKQEGAVNPESCYYYCAVCDYSTKVKLNLVQHVRSVKHQQTEGLRKLQLHQQGLAPEEDNLSEIFFVKDCPPNELVPYAVLHAVTSLAGMQEVMKLYLGRISQ
ncbi:hypothetical protein P7K49_027032 [Saguinus oedipus]|uniref:ZFHX4 n=1 Tax=Saguinus oedipus TaxID=9490 RepID=A0ABQ9UFE5_SAGOE|nr:hypothetical protein P7K49_027032 [Saguinus oedipus]